MYREPEDLEVSHQLLQVPEKQIPEGRAIALPRRNEPDIASAAKSAPAKPRRAARKLSLAVSAAAIAVAAGSWYGAQWWTTGRFMISTDDAYVRAHNTTLASKVSGYLASIPLDDNAQVHAGDIIATIDDGDYQLAADAAREKVATQQATVDRFGQQILAQQSNIDQAKAQVLSVRAADKKNQLEFERQHALAARAFASHQALEQAEANRDQGTAAVQSAQSALDAASANLEVLKAQQREAMRTLDELKTALARAERDLSFTVIRAPVDGVFANRAVQTGDFVQTGQRLASLVPLDEVYVDANFKETQLARLLPGHEINGRIASLSPASGSVFSLLPPDNATGNFTKIVQRLPVRIEVPATVGSQQMLRPGMSVVVSVDTKRDSAKSAARTAQAEQTVQQ